MFLAGYSPHIRPYTVYIYGSGQPYLRMSARSTDTGFRPIACHQNIFCKDEYADGCKHKKEQNDTQFV